MGANASLNDDRWTVRPNPFIRFNRAAEAAGYPALLFEALLALAIMVAAVVLLALIEAAWALAWAMLSLVVAIAIVSAAMMAAFSEEDEDPAAQRGAARSTSQETEAVVPLPQREPTGRQRPQDRKAA